MSDTLKHLENFNFAKFQQAAIENLLRLSKYPRKMDSTYA